MAIFRIAGSREEGDDVEKGLTLFHIVLQHCRLGGKLGKNPRTIEN